MFRPTTAAPVGRHAVAEQVENLGHDEKNPSMGMAPVRGGNRLKDRPTPHAWAASVPDAARVQARLLLPLLVAIVAGLEHRLRVVRIPKQMLVATMRDLVVTD